MKGPFLFSSPRIQMKKVFPRERENGKDKKSSIAIVKFISGEMILNCSPSWTACAGREKKERYRAELFAQGAELRIFFNLKLSRNHFISLADSLIFLCRERK